LHQLVVGRRLREGRGVDIERAIQVVSANLILLR
jgi:hypothetical protein